MREVLVFVVVCTVGWLLVIAFLGLLFGLALLQSLFINFLLDCNIPRILIAGLLFTLYYGVYSGVVYILKRVAP
jgi:hypothetical protein